MKIQLSKLSKETRAAIRRELSSAEEVTLRFNGYDQPKELTDYILAGYPELSHKGEFWQTPIKMVVQDVLSFMKWLQAAPAYKSIEAKHTKGKSDILVNS